MMKVWLLQMALKSPVTLGAYPLEQLSEHTVPLGEDDGQLPAVSGYGGVGAEHSLLMLIAQYPEGEDNTPKLHVTERLPLPTYPLAQPREHCVPDGMSPAQLPVVFGNDTAG